MVLTKKRTSLAKWYVWAREREGERKSTCTPANMGWILFFFLLKKGKKIIRWCHSCCRCIYNQVKWVKASEVAEEDNKHKKAPTFEMFTATKRVSFCATQRNRTHEILLSVEKNFRKCLSNSIFLLLASVKIPVMSATQKWLTGWLTRFLSKRHFLMGKCGKFLRTVYGVLIISESEEKECAPFTIFNRFIY